MEVKYHKTITHKNLDLDIKNLFYNFSFFSCWKRNEWFICESWLEADATCSDAWSILSKIFSITVIFDETFAPPITAVTGFLLSPNTFSRLFISEATNEKVQITIKITLGSINEIIQTFRRYNYEIVSEHQEDDYLNTLKERSEYLDKYLNI